MGESAVEEYEKLIQLDYGIHGVEITFVLKGDKGAISFGVYTGWLLPSIVGITDPDDMFKYGELLAERNKNIGFPKGICIAYHSPVQHYEWQSKNDCEYTKEGYCYSDASYTYSDKILKRLIEEGVNAVWDELSEWYIEQLINYEPDNSSV